MAAKPKPGSSRKSSPDKLVKSPKKKDIELKEDDLKNVTGGAQVDYFIKNT